MNVCVIGMWHLGSVTAGCLAKLGNQVACFDYDRQAVDGLRAGNPPVHEPGLKELFTEGVLRGNIRYPEGLKEAISDSDVVYIAFDTPVDESDKIDLAPIHKAACDVIPLLGKDTLLVISSQVPVGTCDRILEKMESQGRKNGLCYTPENLRLGTAIESFMKPERIVCGLSTPDIKEKIERLFSGIDARFLFMSLRSAEMAKHALNSYLATMISFSSEISDLCERTDANAADVMTALKTERRVSPYAPIMPGLGFGGGTLARDVQVLRALGDEKDTPTDVLDSVMTVNARRMDYVKNRLTNLLGTLDGKKIAFFGLAYKAGTNTLRRSLTLQVIGRLKDTGVRISAYDPMIRERIVGYEHVDVCKTAPDAAKGADAVVIMTDWEEFKNMDYAAMAKAMKNPILLDAKNMLDAGRFSGTKIRYYGIGL